MLLPIILFIVAIFLLFLSSQALIRKLIKIFYYLTHSHHTSVNILFFLLLPGIFLHEFSHILAAELLQVPTGHLSLKPQFKNNQLKLGSAQIAQTDPIRLTLIGTAPFFSGTLTLWLLLKFGLNLNLSTITFSNLIPQFIFSIQQLAPITLLITFYLLFAITNTMFSSPTDLQAAGFPLILIIILLITLNFTSLTLPINSLNLFQNFLFSLSLVFSITLIINIIILLFLKLIR